MNLNLKKYSFTLIISLLVLWFINSQLITLFPSIFLFTDGLLQSIYIFLGIINIIHFFILKVLFAKWIKQVGFIYMALSFLKMLACVLFIVISIINDVDEPISAVLNFMVVYFTTLFVEVLFVVKNMIKVK